MSLDNKIIIGSGLSGPLLAIYLSQRNHSVDLYEKRPDLRVENISVGRSINLALSYRGIKALQSAGIFDKIEPILNNFLKEIFIFSNKLLIGRCGRYQKIWLKLRFIKIFKLPTQFPINADISQIF